MSSTHLSPTQTPTGILFALAAVLLWSSLAALGVSLRHVPPFLLTGIGLLVGSLVAVPLSRGQWSHWKVPPGTLVIGVLGLFGYHAMLFAAFHYAPPLQANLINYLWPLGMVVLAPLYLRGLHWRWQHIAAALVGFAGAVLALLDGGQSAASGDAFPLRWWGYGLALAAAFTWASYSLLTQRVPPFRTAAIGSFCLGAGILSLIMHALFEPATALSTQDWLLLALLGIGPTGGAFFVWDAALKRTDARTVGLLAFLTPLLSTMLLLVTSGQPFTIRIALATLLIVGAAVVGMRSGSR